MPLAPSSQQALPQWVDARKFAYQGVQIEGDIDLKSLPRLATAVVGGAEPVHAALQFALDPARHRVVTGHITAALSVTCQRCLQPMAITVDADLSVAIVATEEKAQQLPKHLEPWLLPDVEEMADLYEVIEDELLLSMPMVAYHDHQCLDKSLYSTGTVQEEKPAESKKHNPFAVLGALKQSDDEK